jgi:gas vesicle protein
MARYRRKNSVFSFLIGGIIGGAAALVMAPASGTETRTNISNGVNSLLQKANVQKNNIIREAQTVAKQMVVKAEDIYKTSSDFAAGKYSISAEAIQLEIESIKKAINAAVDTYTATKAQAVISNPLANEVIVNEMHSDFEDESLPKQEGMGRRVE